MIKFSGAVVQVFADSLQNNTKATVLKFKKLAILLNFVKNQHLCHKGAFSSFSSVFVKKSYLLEPAYYYC